MKNLGFILIVAGFVASSYFTVLDATEVRLGPFAVGLAVSVVGVALARIAVRRESQDEERLQASIEVVGRSLRQITREAEKLDTEKEALGVYELRHEIERRFPAQIDAFVEARESMAHSFGLQAYADVMDTFAAGERYLNRVWSASTDGYVDEAHTYIGRARQQFRRALDVFEGSERKAAISESSTTA